MEAQRVIEDRDTIIQSPPDILLTNFKMLDFALMRGDFHPIWAYNFKNPELLKFLVLDELHTYDGAKGSDEANLIRRLKMKLSLSSEQIIPIGTSATMGGGEGGKQELMKFFGEVFGVLVTSDAVIEEHRLNLEDFFIYEMETPSPDFTKSQDLELKEDDDYDSFLLRQFNFWGYSGLSRVELSDEFKKMSGYIIYWK